MVYPKIKIKKKNFNLLFRNLRLICTELYSFQIHLKIQGYSYDVKKVKIEKQC